MKKESRIIKILHRKDKENTKAFLKRIAKSIRWYKLNKRRSSKRKLYWNHKTYPMHLSNFLNSL